MEKTSNAGLEFLPYRFTAKELDEETGLYYYDARYLDPKYSRWISTDPALGDYLPSAPISEEAKRHNQNLPGMGGVFNHINGNLYHYAANNPVRYVDPDGRVFNLVAAAAGIVIGAGAGAVVAWKTGGSGKDIASAALGGAAGGALAGFTCGASLAVAVGIGGAAIVGGAVVAAGTDIAINVVQDNDVLDGVDKAALGGGLGGGVGYVAGVCAGLVIENLPKNVLTDSLESNPNDPFDFNSGNYNANALRNARNDIKTNGNISKPILVKDLKNGKYQIQDGHHRWYAAKQMNIPEVPVQIIE